MCLLIRQFVRKFTVWLVGLLLACLLARLVDFISCQSLVVCLVCCLLGLLGSCRWFGRLSVWLVGPVHVFSPARWFAFACGLVGLVVCLITSSFLFFFLG